MSALSTNSPIEIRLLGEKISLKSSGDPELVKEVIEIVRIRIREAEKRVRGTVPPHHVAMIALLEMAEEYVQAKHRALNYRSQVDEKTRELSHLIEAEFK